MLKKSLLFALLSVAALSARPVTARPVTAQASVSAQQKPISWERINELQKVALILCPAAVGDPEPGKHVTNSMERLQLTTVEQILILNYCLMYGTGRHDVLKSRRGL